MAKVKIISNPYNREIMYLTFREQSGLWEKIEVYNPNSRLREDESGKSFLPFKIKEIIDIIIDEYYIGSEKVEITFEGTNEEYREVEKVCVAEGVADKVVLCRTNYMLENARSILKDTKAIFGTVQPIIAKIVRDDAAVCSKLSKVSDALDDIIPICVFGNYSAGKSTFINALIGSEVLPSGGDPVTAKIYEIRRSEHPDISRVRFTYHNDPIELLFDGGIFRVLKGDMTSDILIDLCQIIKDYAKEDLFVVVNKALEFINGYEKKDKDVIDIGDVIEVEIPFSTNGILGRSQNNFVIFDTPGSNSASNSEHSVVLEQALRGFSNGIPVWVSQYESIDSEDNAALCEKILSIEALDNRFTMIVLNKADGSDLPEDGFSSKQIKAIMEYQSVEKMFASGIFFVSSIMGLGAKNKGELRDKHYRRIYRSQQEMYSDPDDMDYAMLYIYDIMPEQIKAELCGLSAGHPDLVYANSGLYCIEQEMEDFASKYSAYNKCQMVYVFLNEVIAETSARIASRTATLERTRANRLRELEAKKQELIAILRAHAGEREHAYDKDSRIHIRAFATEDLDYSYSREDLEKMDAELASRYSAEANYDVQEAGLETAKDTMWSHLRQHGSNLFSRNFREAARAMREDFARDYAVVQANQDVVDSSRRSIDSQTSDVVMAHVVDRYKASLLEAKDRISAAAKHHWQGNVQMLKDALISLITESDALSSAQREQLAAIIMDYQPLQFDDDAANVFIKTKFLRGGFFGMAGDSERLNIRRLVSKYNEKILANILEMANDINASCFASYKTWQASLLFVIEQNITEYNPQLRDMNEMIREETEKINELNADQQTISQSLEMIKHLMSWKTVDFEEMHYGS